MFKFKPEERSKIIEDLKSPEAEKMTEELLDDALKNM